MLIVYIEKLRFKIVLSHFSSFKMYEKKEYENNAK